MTRYVTTEEQYQCWGCGYNIPIRSMWTKKAHPFTHRCPGCKENILFICIFDDEPDNIRRAGAYYGPLPYVDYTDPLFEDAHVPVLND